MHDEKITIQLIVNYFIDKIEMMGKLLDKEVGNISEEEFDEFCDTHYKKYENEKFLTSDEYLSMQLRIIRKYQLPIDDGFLSEIFNIDIERVNALKRRIKRG